ncbi:MAG: redox-sensing transcriptional repressor Rex [Clostridia bacterium]|nr:redox-sensing transcriptional repressor Rex [Clostridia bacterium]
MKKNKQEISPAVIRRLPRYYRYLTELERLGFTKISSSDLSRKIQVTASQIRQDLNCFGDFGQQGYGYNVKSLRESIADILGIRENNRAVIIGVGHLGSAIANHTTLEKCGVELIGLFDNSLDVLGKTVAGHLVRDIKDVEAFCIENRVNIAVLTLPKQSAEVMARRLASAGVTGFWNFANTELRLPDLDVHIENVHMGDSLMQLCYKLKSGNDEVEN